MARAVGMPPSGVGGAHRFRLASWDLPPFGRIDKERHLGWVGSLRGMPERVSLETAAGFGGQYALICAQPDGLLLARGRHAGRCMYFTRLADGGVAACSRLEPLLACSSRTSPNVHCLAQLILLKFSDDPSATAFNEVR